MLKKSEFTSLFTYLLIVIIAVAKLAAGHRNDNHFGTQTCEL